MIDEKNNVIYNDGIQYILSNIHKNKDGCSLSLTIKTHN